MDNANPTVLNASELPTRRGKGLASAKSESGSILSLLEPTLNPAMQIYLDGEEPVSESEEESVDEPIDEQEIFGEPSYPHSGTWEALYLTQGIKI